tara:strand:- start:208 stop:921 length:714 start_codon:yes stop_codon:yes gene_type:complete
MNMNWWNIVKSTPRSRREKKEEQQWIEDFKNEINQKHKFSEPEGLNDTTDAWGDPLRSGKYGDVFNERQLAERRHKLGREHDFKEQESEHSDDSGQMRDRVRAIADKQLPKEHGVARRNMTVSPKDFKTASSPPIRGQTFDEEAGSEQPTLDVGYTASNEHIPTDDDGNQKRREGLRPKDVDNSNRPHPLNPWNWYNAEGQVPKEAQTAIDTNMQRRKDNQRKDHWVDTPFGQRQEW